MLRRTFLALIAGSGAAARWDVSAAAPRLPFRIVDAMPTFWRFWDTTIKEPADQRVRAFFDTVVAGYPDLFHHGLIASGALTDLGSVPEVQARVAKYLQDVSTFIPTMRHLTSTIREGFFSLRSRVFRDLPGLCTHHSSVFHGVTVWILRGVACGRRRYRAVFWCG